MISATHVAASDIVAAAVEAIRRRWSCEARVAVILGTGLGELADEVKEAETVRYQDIPGLPRSTALAHKGRLVCGEVLGMPVMMLQGRCHRYEGYSLAELTLGVRVLAALGVTTLVVTNAAGGLNPDYAIGDVMLIDDHINLMGSGGTLGLRTLALGRPARAATRLYDRELAERATKSARESGFSLQRGTYIAVSGPCYETRAEYRAFRRLGGDCVGMSTVPEVLTAASLGLRVLGLSTVTNVACPDAPKIVSAEEVVEVAHIALPRVRAIIHNVIMPCEVPW
jgi:purine-nucleoside phosphorylase